MPFVKVLNICLNAVTWHDSIKLDTSTSRSHLEQELCPWAYLHSKRPWVTLCSMFHLRHGVTLSPLCHNSYSLSTGCETLLSAATLTCTHIHHSSLALPPTIPLFVFPLMGLNISSFASSLSVSVCLVMPRFLLDLNRVRWNLFLLFYLYSSPFFFFLFLSLSLSLICSVSDRLCMWRWEQGKWRCHSTPKDCQHVKGTFNHLAFKELRRFENVKI